MVSKVKRSKSLNEFIFNSWLPTTTNPEYTDDLARNKGNGSGSGFGCLTFLHPAQANAPFSSKNAFMVWWSTVDAVVTVSPLLKENNEK